MNWFERYGIVGAFFIVMTGMWYFCLFPGIRELFNNIKPEHLKFIGGFCGLSFLPFGYIIMICSQRWYYSKKRIHYRYWIDLPEEQRKKILKLGEELGGFNQADETQLEAIFTYYDRKYFSPLETNKFISSFATKRFDVIAINNGLIWAIIFSLIAAICIELVRLNITIKELVTLAITIMRDTLSFSTWFVIILAILITIVLRLSERIQEKQIFEIGRRKLRDMEIEWTKKDSKMIREKAYFIWENKGKRPGKDMENWIEAEEQYLMSQK
ncbi:MAG: hypothetical protein US89_C0022G0003 [Candidatus Peregrinibacteria bacterium GW2011_GWF2_38_29]|nr:MAG: hypothetical protein US89_C0022G0003 [Candidatus Peregrinibacteria bacterium GW2011_GWF2_38_29]